MIYFVTKRPHKGTHLGPWVRQEEEDKGYRFEITTTTTWVRQDEEYKGYRLKSKQQQGSEEEERRGKLKTQTTTTNKKQ